MARATYNPGARDADLDRIVQEGTPFARPATPRAPRVPRAEMRGDPRRADPFATRGVRQMLDGHDFAADWNYGNSEGDEADEAVMDATRTLRVEAKVHLADQIGKRMLADHGDTIDALLDKPFNPDWFPQKQEWTDLIGPTREDVSEGMTWRDVADTPEELATLLAELLVNQWASTASDHEPLAMEIQRRVGERWGLPFQYRPDRISRSGRVADLDAIEQQAIAEHMGPAIDAYIDATYKNTQDALRAAGATEVTLYRGAPASFFPTPELDRPSALDALDPLAGSVLSTIHRWAENAETERDIATKLKRPQRDYDPDHPRARDVATYYADMHYQDDMTPILQSLRDAGLLTDTGGDLSVTPAGAEALNIVSARRAMNPNVEVTLRDMNPLSSFATTTFSALDFAASAVGEPGTEPSAGIGRVVKVTVPASSIWATVFTGPGCLIENEMIVLGTDGMTGIIVEQV